MSTEFLIESVASRLAKEAFETGWASELPRIDHYLPQDFILFFVDGSSIDLKELASVACVPIIELFSEVLA